MPSNYSTKYNFADVGENKLIAKLKEFSFEVAGATVNHRITYLSQRGNKIEVGFVDNYANRCYLEVLEMEDNPLYEFVKQFPELKQIDRNKKEED